MEIKKIIMKLILILLLVILMLFSNSPLLSKITKQVEFYDKINKNFVEYHFIDKERYKIVWGNKNIKKTSHKIFKVLGSGTLGVQESNLYGLILRQSCGTECWYNVILPLKGKIKEKVVQYGLTYDLKNNLIVYSNANRPFLTIYNIMKGKKQVINERDVCAAITPAVCIDTCYIQNGFLFIRWENLKKRISQKKVKIKI
jgi:hypothetical protein